MCYCTQTKQSETKRKASNIVESEPPEPKGGKLGLPYLVSGSED